MKASDRGRNVKSKEFFGCFDDFCTSMSHIVDSCPLSRFEGGLQQLHTADDRTVHWLETAAKKALAK